VAPSAGIQIGELSRRTGLQSRRSAIYDADIPPTGARSERRTLSVLRQPPMFGGWAFIRRARELGFTLDEVRALLALSANDRQDTCAQVRELAAGHLSEVSGENCRFASYGACPSGCRTGAALPVNWPDVQ